MNYAIILAGGKGSRMKSSIPKQYIKLNNRPMICYSLDVFEHNTNIDGIVVVTAADYMEYMRQLISENSYSKVIDITEGGKERYDSVYSGLNCIRRKAEKKSVCKENSIAEPDNSVSVSDEDNYKSCMESEYIYIHDGARPCVSDNIINACTEAVAKYKACVAAVPVKDTIKVADKNGLAINTPDRSTLWQIQTPQVFERKLITEAYDRLYEDTHRNGITDDAMIVERYMNAPVKIAMSEYTNIKATTPEDILITELFLKK